MDRGQFGKSESWVFMDGSIYTIAGICIPAEGYGVCGDVIAVENSNIDDCRIVVIDGIGKGDTAYIMAENCLRLLMPYIGSYPLAEVMERLDAQLSEELKGEYAEKSLSLCILSLSFETGEVRFVNAGSPPIFMIHREDGVEVIERCDPPVGMGFGLRFTERQVNLTKGDSLVVTSDGVTGTKLTSGILNVEEVQLMLEASIRRSPQQTLSAFASKFIQLSQGVFYDDATIVVIGRR